MFKSQIPNPKSQFPIFQTNKFRLLTIWSLVIIWCLVLGVWNLSYLFAQQSDDLEFRLDVSSKTVSLPKLFQPNIDLSGRGFHQDASWPQGLAAKETLDAWQKVFGLGGVYRLQYNLWEINQLSRDKELQAQLLANYESVIKTISDSGGRVILNIFGTPAGLGRVLDKKSPPWDLKAFKGVVQGYIKELSCQKRYNVWYEVWSAPDLENFFVGDKQEYFKLYRMVAEGIQELENQYKIDIAVGGPSSSWWFQNFDGNTIVVPERSLIYELIKFCYKNKLPLDFISWHAYSTDPQAEKELTAYNKTATTLIREWLSYFDFDPATPLIVDEWNYDRLDNLLAERDQRSFICASFIPARLKNMFEAGLNHQVFFSLEDFKENRQGVIRNTGIFWFASEPSGYKSGSKCIYNVFRFLTELGKEMYSAKIADQFVGIIPTRKETGYALLVYNYVDPDISQSYLSRNICALGERERRVLLHLIKTYKLEKLIRKEIKTSELRLKGRVQTLLEEAQALHKKAQDFLTTPRKIKISIKNLKENYLYKRYAVDSSCSFDCAFIPVEEKEVDAGDLYAEELVLAPYSVQLIVLEKKPQVAVAQPVVEEGP